MARASHAQEGDRIKASVESRVEHQAATTRDHRHDTVPSISMFSKIQTDFLCIILSAEHPYS